ncbi:MAG: hypothetical protein B7Z55_18345 [Planctomycetales bacterium 12-60-4]|nr:MAG: hypothetical protein B7Z55_18345 [Planctomycetales bacterium 12-60-4]
MLLFVSLCGCTGGGNDLATVTGIVTVDGAPVEGIQVVFKPRDIDGSAAYGVTDTRGHYRLMSTRDRVGARPASYDVTLKAAQLSQSELEEMRAQGETVAETPVVLPENLSGPVERTVDVRPGSNVIDFPLTSRAERK